jgi:hypothetical protein
MRSIPLIASVLCFVGGLLLQLWLGTLDARVDNAVDLLGISSPTGFLISRKIRTQKERLEIGPKEDSGER